MPQVVAAEMDKAGRTLLDSPAGRIAFVSISALARLQARRIVAEAGRVGYFENTSDARAWLAAQTTG